MQINNALVVFDLETTGVDTAKDRIIQAAFLKVEPDGTLDRFVTLVNPTIPIAPEATEVHGIRDEDVKDAPTFEQIADRVISFIKGCDLVTYNGNRFDIPLLMTELARVNQAIDLDDVQLVDVMQVESRLNPRTLSAVFERYTGKVLDDAHDAMADVEATYTILQHQLDKLKTTEEPIEYEELEDYYRDGKARTDIAGLFQFNDENKLCWGFGKHRDKSVFTDYGYVDWFYRNSFPEQSKEFLQKYINSSGY